MPNIHDIAPSLAALDFGKLFAASTSGISAAWNSTWEPLFDSLWERFGNTFPRIAGFMEGLFMNFNNTMVDMFNGLNPGITGFFQLFTDAYYAIANGWNNIVNPVFDDWNAKLTAAKDGALKDILQGMVSGFEMLFHPIDTAGKAIGWFNTQTEQFYQYLVNLGKGNAIVEALARTLVYLGNPFYALAKLILWVEDLLWGHSLLPELS